MANSPLGLTVWLGQAEHEVEPGHTDDEVISLRRADPSLRAAGQEVKGKGAKCPLPVPAFQAGRSAWNPEVMCRRDAKCVFLDYG